MEPYRKVLSKRSQIYNNITTLVKNFIKKNHSNFIILICPPPNIQAAMS